jgi:hypothetical protein
MMARGTRAWIPVLFELEPKLGFFLCFVLMLFVRLLSQLGDGGSKKKKKKEPNLRFKSFLDSSPKLGFL